ncbi:hypothetical protein GpartN1_g2755.t1 [Galdieria partita]|uniref:Glycerol-3-phosphate dehydrogenase [NAD(+)] n=1 Tax=Galdieria partita TaxID=83374 RepID=A0A9C7PV07_9RHOD|nr:hypothetical protein GpartN1_g2755.t1 [Galdieria partita]
MSSQQERVVIIGSGNWGSAASRLIGKNVTKSSRFEDRVNMWVYEEVLNGQKLTEIINTQHENVKYLPGYKLPKNIVAVPDIVEAVKGATVLVFVVPHQFIRNLCKQMKSAISSHCRGISLIKGIDFNESGPLLITDIIKSELNIPMCALSGANIANEIAAEKFCETTIGYENLEDGELMKELFHDDMFRVGLVKDVAGVQVCGALKNVIALGAGFCDALEMGNNTKSALMRIGLIEMQRFAKKYYSNVKVETFMESCGVADLITTCYGGRNRKCAEAFIRTKKSWNVLEEELLNGQKLQGTTTAKDVYLTLKKDNALEEFPHMVTIYRIAFEGLPVERIVLDI